MAPPARWTSSGSPASQEGRGGERALGCSWPRPGARGRDGTGVEVGDGALLGRSGRELDARGDARVSSDAQVAWRSAATGGSSGCADLRAPEWVRARWPLATIGA